MQCSKCSSCRLKLIMKVKTILAMEIQQNLKMQTCESEVHGNEHFEVSENTNWYRFWNCGKLKCIELLAMVAQACHLHSGELGHRVRHHLRRGGKAQESGSRTVTGSTALAKTPWGRSYNPISKVSKVSKAWGRLVWIGRTGPPLGWR